MPVLSFKCRYFICPFCQIFSELAALYFQDCNFYLARYNLNAYAMDLCMKLSCFIASIAFCFITVAMFTPDWVSLGNELREGLIQLCALHYCKNITDRSTLETAVLTLMILATVSFFIGTVMNVYALLRGKYDKLKMCGLVQGIGALSALIACIVFTTDMNESTLNFLAYGYSYGFAWTGSLLGLCAAAGNLHADSRRSASYQSI